MPRKTAADITRITITLSSEQLARLDHQRQTMAKPKPSRAKAVVMLLHAQLGGPEPEFQLLIESPPPEGSVLLDLGSTSVHVPKDWKESIQQEGGAGAE